MTLLLTQSCRSFLPPFTEEQRSRNPIIAELKNKSVETDRRKFYESNVSLLDKRRVALMKSHPSLASGPKITSAAGDRYWWEDLWMQDFKLAFINQDLKPKHSCLGALIKSATFANADCNEVLTAFKTKWSNAQQNEISDRITYRSITYATYMKTLWSEVQNFDEAYRMQF